MLLKISKGLASLASLIFLASGIGWHVAPEFAAGQLGMTLLAGVGLSSQIGDLERVQDKQSRGRGFPKGSAHDSVFQVNLGGRYGTCLWFGPSSAGD